MKRVRVVVSGRVQAVGFRWACREEARRLHLGGFVSNLADDRVDADVDAMVAWCRTGPSWASVTDVQVIDEAPKGERKFIILD